MAAFPWDSAPRYLLRDHDGNYGEPFRQAADLDGHSRGIDGSPITLAERLRGTIHWLAHRIHIVVRHMAVEHPLTRIVGDEFDVARLCNAHENCIHRSPHCFGLSASFRARYNEGVAV
jgi:hypothetical protein